MDRDARLVHAALLACGRRGIELIVCGVPERAGWNSPKFCATSGRRVKVSVVITNHDTWPLTVRCVNALERHSRGRIGEIVVVDDASATPAPADLPASARVLHNPKNLGYQASVNVGFRAVSGDWVLLLDSDAYPLMDVVEPLERSFAADPELAAIALATVDERGRATQTAQSEPRALGFLLGPRLEGAYVKLRDLWGEPQLVVYSCALAVRKSAFEAVGGFDEGFDFLDADLDFSMRLSEAGFKVTRDPSLVAFHRGSGSPQTQSKRVLRCYRNRWRLLAKHRKLPAPAAFKVLLALRHALEIETLLALLLVTPPGPRRELYADKLRVRYKLGRAVWSGYREAV
jgi:GT2 family glycosyltransferase